ncbi:hypothetical protein BO204_005334, partial [Escherichia coli]|nr:hypothetical protein [Escherichia coli]
MAYVFRYTLNGDYDAANSADILIYDGSTMASAISPDASMSVGQAYNVGDLPNGAFYYFQSLNGGQHQVTNSFRDANDAMMFLGTAGLFLQWSSDNAARVTLTGSNFGDVLIGGAGNDTLHGNDGDDILEGGAGADTIKGGFGDDTVSYEHAYSGVILYMDGSG